ncbi:hypothetical protein ACFZAU_09120 [Streptomyces sp. NPDC008238]
MGFGFPSDYRAFVDRYGGGFAGTPDSLRSFVYAPSSVPLAPGRTSGFRGFVDWHASEIAPLFTGWDEDEWGGTAYSMHPEPGGLLTWGENQAGDLYCWLTEGDDPDAWPVVMWARGPATTYRFDMGMVRFLHSLAGGNHPAPDWMHSAGTRWTLTTDWLHRALNTSAARTPG